MEPAGVTQEPNPLSPSNRNRVHKVEPTNRSHNVQYQPKEHSQIREFQSNPFVAQAKQPTDLEARNPPGGKEFRLVAPTGFEPALPA